MTLPPEQHPAPLLRVLYAEGNTVDADLTHCYLTRHAPHCQLTLVTTAQQVLEKLPARDDRPLAFDILLLDAHLPDLDVLKLTQTLRLDRGLHIPIVLVSRHVSENEMLVAQALDLGVNEHLFKHDGYLYELVPTLEKVRHQVQLERERQSFQETSRYLNHLLNASPVILYTLRLEGTEVRPTWVSGNIEHLLGYTAEQALTSEWWPGHLHEEDRDDVHGRLRQLLRKGHLTHEYRFLDAAGRIRWIRDEMRTLEGTSQPGTEVIGAWQDITREKQASHLQQTRLAVLDCLVGNSSLPEILMEIAHRLEQNQPGMRVSILLLDPRSGRLITGAAPSLPDDYNAAVNGLKPGVGHGSCGTAAALGEPVIVPDILTHPYWAAYTALATRVGLRACWSVPFKDDAGQVLGTFAVYYGEPREPSQTELDLIDEFTRITSLAVQRVRAATAMRQAATVFKSTREGVVITDLKPCIINVNRAFTEITGYQEQDVIGRNPKLLQSGQHDKSFFRTIWQTVRQSGHWQGEIWNRRKSGELFPQLLTISTVYDEHQKPTHYVGVMTDITHIKQSEKQLERLAHYDPLTDLPNRLLFNARLKHALQQARRYRGQLAVMFLDLDRFKQINDSFGHPVGDQVLKAAAERLGHCVRVNDTVARIGGDEFLILLESIHHPDNAAVVAEKILHGFSEPFDLEERELFITPSIGICFYPRDGEDGETLIRNADTAMYEAKKRGRNSYAFYSEQLTSHAFEQVMMENRLRKAIERNELQLYFQPQLELRTGRQVGVEALVRWEHPDLGMIYPARFIPLAEETELIIDIGRWVLETACGQAREWLNRGFDFGRLAINVAGPQIRRQVVLEQVQQALAVSLLPADRLELEVTEGFIMDGECGAVEMLESLRQLGVSLSIDDFGTGYSSLAYLKRLPINQLKIDQSFVREIPQDPDDMAIVRAVIALAKSLGLAVIAEGVETEEQRRFLIAQGCTRGQGYLFARPLSTRDFTAFLKASRQR